MAIFEPKRSSKDGCDYLLHDNPLRRTKSMEFKLFNDLIDALGKVAIGLKAIVNMPKAERETIRQTMTETYRFIDTTPNMVIIRLGGILLHDPDYSVCQVASPTHLVGGSMP